MERRKQNSSCVFLILRLITEYCSMYIIYFLSIYEKRMDISVLPRIEPWDTDQSLYIYVRYRNRCQCRIRPKIHKNFIQDLNCAIAETNRVHVKASMVSKIHFQLTSHINQLVVYSIVDEQSKWVKQLANIAPLLIAIYDCKY